MVFYSLNASICLYSSYFIYISHIYFHTNVNSYSARILADLFMAVSPAPIIVPKTQQALNKYFS